jgi:dGTPase
MITTRMLIGITLWELLTGNIQWRGPELEDMDRHRLIRKLIGVEVTDLVNATDERIKDSGAKSPLDIQKLKHNVIGFSEEIHRRNRELKDFLYARMYRHHRVVRMQVKAERILSDLFHAYRAEPAILPEHIQKIVTLRGLERTICDYIAGMTDRYATEEHQKLFNPLEMP